MHCTSRFIHLRGHRRSIHVVTIVHRRMHRLRGTMFLRLLRKAGPLIPG